MIQTTFLYKPDFRTYIYFKKVNILFVYVYVKGKL